MATDAAGCRQAMAELASAAGDHIEAVSLFDRAASAFADAGDGVRAGWCRFDAAAVLLECEDVAGATASLDLARKLAEDGYVALAPDFYSRFTGDREALARGEARADLKDDNVLEDFDAALDFLRTVPEADTSRLAMIGVCATGRQPLLAAAHRDHIAGAASKLWDLDFSGTLDELLAIWRTAALVRAADEMDQGVDPREDLDQLVHLGRPSHRHLRAERGEQAHAGSSDPAGSSGHEHGLSDEIDQSSSGGTAEATRH